MGSFWPGAGTITEDDLARHEDGINRVAWSGSVAVAAVTLAMLGVGLVTMGSREL